MNYSVDWYRFLAEGSRRSAERILPLVLESFPVASALDVGCGTAAWAATLRALGIDDVIGVDGEYVDTSLLEIPPELFLPLDIGKPFDLGRTFDLVLAMEVAEHLPASAADKFVASLVRHARLVLFSAAIPGQGGVDHFNEQWPDYWAARFKDHGYVALDVIRPRVWTDPAVECWYAQNTILFAGESHVGDDMRPSIVHDLGRLSVVHPQMFELIKRQPKARRLRLFLEAILGNEGTNRLSRLVRKLGYTR